MIRFLIDTTVSRRDSNGNCYNYSIVTSTNTGRTMKIDSGWGSDGGNIKAFLRRAGIEWHEMHYTECVIPIREYNRLQKLHPNKTHEHQVTGEMILALEGKR